MQTKYNNCLTVCIYLLYDLFIRRRDYERKDESVLLIGLILSTICYALYTVVSLLGMFGIFGILTSGDAILNMAGFIYLGIMLLVFIFCLLGLIFSGISFTRVGMAPEKFAEKKGMPKTVIVFNFIIAVLLLIGVIQEVNVLAIIVLLALIASAILMIVDIKKNKKLLANATQPEPKVEEGQKEAEVSETTEEK